MSRLSTLWRKSEKSEGALARVFASGLPKAVLEAVGFAKQIVRNHDDRSNLLPAIAALGNLLTITGRHLFKSEGEQGFQDMSDVANGTIPSRDSPRDSQLPSMLPESRFLNSSDFCKAKVIIKYRTLNCETKSARCQGDFVRELGFHILVGIVGQMMKFTPSEEARGMASSEEHSLSAIRSSCPLRAILTRN
jgi:hypothetical protein